MSGWSELDSDAWEVTLEALVRALPPGKLPEEAARIDLRHLESLHRWWVVSKGEHGERWLGQRQIADRWAWTRKRVRLLLAMDDWHSPCNPVPAEQLMAERAKGPSQGPSEGPVKGPVTEGTTPVMRDTVAQSGAQSGPSPGLHARSFIAEEQSTEIPFTGEVVTLVVAPPPEAAPPPRPDADAELWARLMGLLEQTGHGRAIELTDDRRRRLRGCVRALDGERDGRERLESLWSWWLLGPNDWWRSKFAGSALLAKLLQPQRIDERALEVPDDWSGATSVAINPVAEAERAWSSLRGLFSMQGYGHRNPAKWPDEVFGADPQVQRAFRRSLLEHGGADIPSDDFTRRRFISSFQKHLQARSA